MTVNDAIAWFLNLPIRYVIFFVLGVLIASIILGAISKVFGGQEGEDEY